MRRSDGIRARRQLAIAAVAGLLSFTSNVAPAAPVNLQSGISSVVINPTSDQAVTSWLVDGVSQMVLQGFYYRIGSVGGESAISTIPLVSQTLLNPSTLSVTYANGTFSIEATYSLLGGSPGSGEASLSEQIRITNLSGGALDFHFFQYADFDLNGTSAGDTVELGKNLQGFYNEAFQFEGATIADTVFTPGANLGQVGSFPDLLNAMNDSLPTTLNGDAGPLNNGDVTWALQWNRLIAAGSSLIIGIDKTLYAVPEPTAGSIAGLSMLLLAALKRSRR